VYVDDIILIGNDAEEISCFPNLLDQHFKIKSLGDLTFFLGLEVVRNSTSIHLSKRKYILNLLHDVGMLDCASMPTPMLHSSRLSPTQGAPLFDIDASSYCRLIGRLLYLTNTRPEITFSVNNLSQFVKAPTKEHQQVAFRVLHYLKTAPVSGIFFHSSYFIQLRCFTDSD